MANLSDNKIKELINSISVEDFSSLSFENYNESKQDFWKYLLLFLKNENQSTKLGHYLVRDSDDIDNGNNTSSVFGRIDELADMDNGSTNIVDELINNLKEHLDLSTPSGTNFSNYFWNESVNYIIAYFMSRINPKTMEELESPPVASGETDTASGTIKTKGAAFRITDVKNADAGRNFTDSGSTIANSAYVRQWFNIDGQNYSLVRGTDAITEVLKDGTNIDFTHKQGTNSWIRLLMPEYLRTVEIEDLDRNFWVIAQVITAICAYLFDDDSPIPNAFKQILNELVLLWENVLYLWAALAMVTREPYYERLHCEFVVLNNLDILPYVKFDNFDNTAIAANPNSTEITLTESQRQSLWNRLSHLVQEYNECNLCIVPEIRFDNYEHNYYAHVYYPGAFLYNRNIKDNDSIGAASTNKILFIPFKKNVYSITDELSKKIYSITETETGYNVVAPLYNVYKDYLGKSRIKYLLAIDYYGALRAVPTFNISYSNGLFNATGTNNLFFTLKYYDGIKDAVQNDNFLVHTANWNLSGEKTVTEAADLTAVTNKNITKNNLHGYYLGEMLSGIRQSGTIDLTIKVRETLFEPLGGPGFPSDDKKDPDSWNPQKGGGKWNELKDDLKDKVKTRNVTMLRTYVDLFENTPTLDPEGITLLYAMRKSDLKLQLASIRRWVNSLTNEDRFRAIGNKLGGYYTINPNQELERTGSYYQGHYYDPSVNNAKEKTVRRYFLQVPSKTSQYVYLTQGRDESGKAMSHDLIMGYDRNKEDTQGLLDLHESAYAQEADKTLEYRYWEDGGAKTSPTYSNKNKEKWYSNDDYHLGFGVHYKDNNTNYGILRYNTYGLTIHCGAYLYAPLLGNLEYKDYKNLGLMLPQANEAKAQHFFLDKEVNGTSVIRNDDDYAFCCVSEDDDNGSYGRRSMRHTYTYIFKKRGEQLSKDNWFFMLVLPYATFRPVKGSLEKTCGEILANRILQSSTNFGNNYKTSGLDDYEDSSVVSTLKRKGITQYSLASPYGYDVSYHGGGNSGYVVTQDGKDIERIWSSTFVSPFLARYCAIREEMNKIFDKYSDKEKYTKNNFELNSQLSDFDKMKFIKVTLKSSETKNLNLDWSIEHFKATIKEIDRNDNVFLALLRTAIANTEARFNGNLYYNDEIMRLTKWSERHRGRADASNYLWESMVGQWQDFSSNNISEIKDRTTNTTVSIDNVDFRKQILTLIANEWKPYTNPNDDSRYTVIYDLKNITFSDLLFLSDVTDSGDFTKTKKFFVADNDGNYKYQDSTYLKVYAKLWNNEKTEKGTTVTVNSDMSNPLPDVSTLNGYYFHVDITNDKLVTVVQSNDLKKKTVNGPINRTITNMKGYVNAGEEDSITDFISNSESITQKPLTDLIQSTVSDDSNPSFYETMSPIISSTRISFFLPHNVYETARTYLVDEDYTIYNQKISESEVIQGCLEKNPGYGISTDETSNVDYWLSKVEEYRDHNSDSEYERVDKNKYYLDFFSYPYTGLSGTKKIPNIES